jgi:hypothetical protein
LRIIGCLTARIACFEAILVGRCEGRHTYTANAIVGRVLTIVETCDVRQWI